MFVDRLTTDGLVLYVSNEQPLLDEVINVTAFLSDNDKVRVCVCVCVCMRTRAFMCACACAHVWARM